MTAPDPATHTVPPLDVAERIDLPCSGCSREAALVAELATMRARLLGADLENTAHAKARVDLEDEITEILADRSHEARDAMIEERDAELRAARTLVPQLVARVRALEADAARLESERDALRTFVNAEREKTLARFRAGCLVCGAMAWKITANGNMQCGQCANIFDAPVVANPAEDSPR